MKPVRRHQNFDKHFTKRIAPNKKLVNQFEKRLSLFVAGKRDNPIYDHALSGALVGKRAFSITSNIRVIYVETDEAIIFIDVGTHNQVY